MRRTILHVGADKCGSTSIQAFLSRSPLLTTSSGKGRLAYACLQRSGFLDAAAIRQQLRKSLTGHLNSLSIQHLRLLDERTTTLIARKAQGCRSDLILSCEGWLRSFAHQDSLDFLLRLLALPARGRSLEVLAFVRSPVAWINSAWWQWGAWEWQGSFEDWIEGGIRATCWESFLAPLRQHPQVARLIVEPLQLDVLAQLRRLLAIDAVDLPAERFNVSLPAEALYLYQRFRDLRPSAHQARIDYLLMNTIGPALAPYRPTPWVLQPQHVERILQGTRESSTRLLELLDDSSRRQVLADERWWQAEAFADRVAIDPFDAGSAGGLQVERLAHDLLEELDRVVQILQSHDLADLYLRASRPPRDGS